MLAPPRNEITTSQDLDRFLRVGSQSASGATVTADTAVTVAAVYACARNVAEDIGKLPYPVYRRLPNDGKERAVTSPFWGLIHDRPFGGPTTFGLSSQQFREFLTFCAILRGDGFAFKNVIAGQVRELIPIHPTRVRIEQLPDGEVIYRVTQRDGSVKDLTRREIFHLMGPTLNGINGASVISLARNDIGLALTAAEHTGNTLRGGGRHRLIIERPLEAPEWSRDTRERVIQEYEEGYAGANSYRTLFLEDGMHPSTVSMSNEDLELLATRKLTIADLARWFRMPLHKIQEMDRATFSNIEVQSLEYVTDTLMSWGVRWDTAWNQQVIITNQLYAELLFAGLLRGVTKDRYEAYQLAINSGWMNRNEARRLENLDPVDGLDDYLTPLNMGIVGQPLPTGGAPTP